jgi:hypothetical protein
MKILYGFWFISLKVLWQLRNEHNFGKIIHYCADKYIQFGNLSLNELAIFKFN